jgi:hypothetical protein
MSEASFFIVYRQKLKVQEFIVRHAQHQDQRPTVKTRKERGTQTCEQEQVGEEWTLQVGYQEVTILLTLSNDGVI